MIYTLTLNSSLDYHIYLHGFTPNSLNIAAETSFVSGGKGINVSKVLNIMGIPSIAMGFLGGFSGNKILEELEQLKITHKFINVLGNTRINIKLHDAANNQETEVAGVPYNVDIEKIEELQVLLENTLEDGDILVCSGSIPSGLKENIYKTIASKLSKAIRVVLDTRGELIKQNIYNNFLIKPNILELQQMFKKHFNNKHEILLACDFFLESGVKNIIVSLGKEGSLYIDENNRYEAKPLKAKSLNTVGAGDAMVAGFLSGIINNLNKKECYKMAIATSIASVVTGGIFTKNLVDSYYKEIIIKNL